MSLCSADSALRRVQEDHPDLVIELLELDEVEIYKQNLCAQVTGVRSALVARLADIGKLPPTLHLFPRQINKRGPSPTRCEILIRYRVRRRYRQIPSPQLRRPRP